MSFEIGKEARELDEKPIKERMKIGRKSLIKVLCSLIIYIITIIIMSVLL